MNKFLILAVSGALALSLCACSGGSNKTDNEDSNNTVVTEESSGQEQGGESEQIPNPWHEYLTLAEANEAVGINFMLPDEYKSDANIFRAISGDVLEIQHPTGDAILCIRVSAVSEDDITGDYNTYEECSVIEIEGIMVEFNGHDADTVNSVSWSDEDLTYFVFSETAIPMNEAQEMVSSIIVTNTLAY